MVEADKNAETTGIEGVEVKFDEIVKMAGEGCNEETAEEVSGQGADVEGLGDEAMHNGAASKGPATWNSQENGGDEDVDHMCAMSEESCTTTYNECQTVSMDAHNDKEAVSKA